MPSQIVYDLLNHLLDPACVRQDHLFMSRTTDDDGRVNGVAWHDGDAGHHTRTYRSDKGCFHLSLPFRESQAKGAAQVGVKLATPAA